MRQRLIVVSNRLPVTLKPEEDALELKEKKVREEEELVARLRRKAEKFVENATAATATASQASSAGYPRARTPSPAPNSSQSPWHNLNASGEEDQESTAEDESIPAGTGSALSYFEFRDALRTLDATLVGDVAVDDLVTETKWKRWIGLARETGSPENGPSSFDEAERSERGRLTFEDFSRIWEAEDSESLSAILRASLALYQRPQAAWRALHGSTTDRLAALQRGVLFAERNLAKAREDLEIEKLRPSAPIKASSGGLVSAMRSVTAGDEGGSSRLLWVGWPGTGVSDEEKRERYAKVLREVHGYFPVYMTEEEADAFYTGFSNSSLWPLLHWMTPYAHYSSVWADAYRRVNERFADAVVQAIREDALKCNNSEDQEYLVWVHDYHLFLVPRMLRERALDYGLNVKTAFFLHTPFPSYEIMCCHPNCRELLHGLLASDLVGFHTYGYLRHFRGCVTRIFGFGTEINHIDHDGMRTKLGVFPIGVDNGAIQQAMRTKEFQQYLKDYAFAGQALVLSVERLDYSKGLPQKLAAIRRFLEITREAEKEQEDNHVQRYVEFDPTILQRVGAGLKKWFGKPRSLSWNPRNTVFLFVAVPSRQEVEEYRAMERDVHNTISEINGQFSTPTHTPIIYIHHSVGINELVALYARADCCLVTPLIDGMNLVAKEFIVTKDRSMEAAGVVPGLVVLSELAGAAQEMFDALVVNPHDVEKVARSIIMALEMPPEDRWQFTTDMRDAVVKNNAKAWAQQVLKELVGLKEKIFPSSKAESLRHLLTCQVDGSGASTFFSEGDWSDMGFKCQVRPHMQLIEVSGHAVPSTFKSVDDIINMVGNADSSGNVVLGFRHIAKLPRSASRAVAPLEIPQVMEAFKKESQGQKALFLDYDGTLRPFASRPDDAVPDEELRTVLEQLNQRQDLDVFIVSGRTPNFMMVYFAQYERITLVAEHGYLISSPAAPGAERTFERFNRHTQSDWMDQVLPVMELSERSTPGSKVEVKSSAIVWHYRNVDPEYGEFKAKELQHALWQSVANLPCEVAMGHMIVEVSSLQVKKGLVVKHFLDEKKASKRPYSAAICIGDDRTDESMFHYVQEEGRGEHEGLVTVKVGRGNTYADYTLKDPAAVLSCLKLLVAESQNVGEDLQKDTSLRDLMMGSFGERVE